MCPHIITSLQMTDDSTSADDNTTPDDNKSSDDNILTGVKISPQDIILDDNISPGEILSEMITSQQKITSRQKR